jgi:hypothetical protein
MSNRILKPVVLPAMKITLEGSEYSLNRNRKLTTWRQNFCRQLVAPRNYDAKRWSILVRLYDEYCNKRLNAPIWNERAPFCI